MKVAALVSGGVDSSVALRLLKQQGHDITAFYLKIWLEDELSFLGDCPWEDDLQYVQAICDKEGIPLKVISLQKEYWEHVVTYTIKEVKAGRTPNPDVFCNKLIKFGLFFDHIDNSYDKVATGHYAQVSEKDGVFFLERAPDAVKDQTYFLSYLKQDQLARALFPIGNLEKAQVRELAQQFDLPNKDRKDSQGICFLGKLKFSEFIKHYLGEQTGELREFESGDVLGHHKGFWYFTIGQRQGTGLSGGPWYVVKKDVEHNIVYVSRNYYTQDKKRNTFDVADINWIAGKPSTHDLQVKLRHGKKMYQCSVELLSENAARVTLAEDDQGIAPGQFAVFYDGSMCLGAGVIAHAL